MKVSGNSIIGNLTITSVGAVVVVLVNLITTPILSRIFTPTAYGTAGLYTQSVSYLALFAGLMLPAAIVVVRKPSVFYRLISSLKFLWLAAFLALLVGVFCLGAIIQELFNDASDGVWLLLLPIGLLAGQAAELISSVNIRAGDFRTNTKATIGGNLFSKGGSLLLGWLTMGNYLALIIPNILSVFIVLSFQKWEQVRKIWQIKPSLAYLKITIQELGNYPKFMLPANLLSLAAISAPFFVFGALYSPTVAGLFLFAENILLIPFRLVGKAVTPVYLQDITNSFYDEEAAFQRLTKRVNNGLFLLGVLPYSLLTVFGPSIFGWVFGEDWRPAGEMAQYLSVFILFRLTTAPLSALYRVAQKESMALITQAVLFVLRVIPLAVGLYWYSLEVGVLLFALGSLFGYWFHFYQVCKIGRLPFGRMLLSQSSIFLLLCMIIHFLGQLI